MEDEAKDLTYKVENLEKQKDEAEIKLEKEIKKKKSWRKTAVITSITTVGVVTAALTGAWLPAVAIIAVVEAGYILTPILAKNL